MAAAKKTVDRQKTLAETLAEMRGKKKQPVGALSDFDMVPEGLPTGNLLLDALTGVGGLPKGRITELIGPPSSGKTTCALQCAAEVQKAGGNVVYLDYEHSLDETYVKALGINTEEASFIYVQPDSFEHGANIFRDLLRTGEINMMVADSVAAMVTEAELNALTGKAEVMQRAKLMHQFCRQIAGPLHKLDTAAVFLNHVMDKVDVTAMGQRMAAQGIVRKTSPGGKALPFYASLRMEFQQMGNVKEEGVNELTQEAEKLATQTRTKVSVLKNKVGDPFRTAELRVRFGKGFSQPYSVLSYLVAQGLVKKNTSGGYKYPLNLQPPSPVAAGESSQLAALESDPKWLETLTLAAQEILALQGLEKIDGSKYDKDGNEIDVNQTVLGLAETEEFESPSDLISGEAVFTVVGGQKIDLSSGEVL